MSRPMTPEQERIHLAGDPSPSEFYGVQRDTGLLCVVPFYNGAYRGVNFIANYPLLMTCTDAKYNVENGNARWPVDSDYGSLHPSKRNVRVVYTGEPSRADNVRHNPGRVFCVVGPFENFSDKPELRDAIEMLVRGFNKEFD